jgi:hypothetical protein
VLKIINIRFIQFCVATFATCLTLNGFAENQSTKVLQMRADRLLAWMTPLVNQPRPLGLAKDVSSEQHPHSESYQLSSHHGQQCPKLLQLMNKT